MTTKTDANPAVNAMFDSLADGARFYTKMVNTMMQEADKQTAEGLKWMGTLVEHSQNTRNEAVKTWTEMMERGMSMGQHAVDAVAGAWRVK